MKIVKRILLFIFEPVRFLGSRNVSNVFVKFFDKNKWATYILAFIITALIFLFTYIN